MPTWKAMLPLDRASRVPVVAQLADAVATDVRRGRLRAGDLLPGSRALARTLGVHRNTVIAAYRELEAAGWITSARGRGTFVSRELPEPDSTRAPRSRLARHEPGFALAPIRTASLARGIRPDVPVVIDWGVPDVRLVPVATLARAYRRALRNHTSTALRYSGASERTPLHRAIAEMLSSMRGLALGHEGERLFLTRGSQMALYLVSQAMLRPGDVVAVEDPGYDGAWEAFRLAGARVIGVGVDHSGLRVDALAELHARHRVRAVFVTPHHQFPTTVTLAASRRMELMAFARAERVAVIEDDYDHEFHYEARPVMPLASVDTANVVIYIGSLSKVLAPGLRVGYVVAPEELVRRIAALRVVIDVQSDQALELALAEMFEDGDVRRNLNRARRIYQARRDLLCGLLAETFGERLRVEPPSGGLALWARAHPSVDVDAWARRALVDGIAFRTSASFSLTAGKSTHLRLGFAARNDRELADAVQALARTLEPRQRATAR